MLGRLIGLVLVLAAIGSAASADEPSVRSVLQARYTALKAAMAARNATALHALLAPDFVSIDVGGARIDAHRFIAELEATPKDPHRTSTTTIGAINVAGSTAIVDQRYAMSTIKTGKDGADRDVALVTDSADTWVKVGTVWLLEKTETKRLDYYENNALIEHRVRAGPT